MLSTGTAASEDLWKPDSLILNLLKDVALKRLLLYLCLPASLAAQSPLRQRADSILSAHPSFSGVVLLADKGKAVFHKAYGYRDFNLRNAVRRKDVFELASVSKQFTAAIIGMLQQEGRLQFDDSLSQYLDLPWKGITVRHLLNHTSGLPDYQAVMDRHWDKSRVAGNPEILAYLRQFPPPAQFAPGTRFEYSNTGYMLLASIAEKASGEDFLDLCRTRIFLPARMKGADIRSLAQKVRMQHFAKGHVFVASQKRFVRADSYPFFDYTVWLGNRKGPGRVSARALDLLRWDEALYSSRYLSAKTLAEAFRPAKLNDGKSSDYGFGWFLERSASGEQVIWHDGDNPGYRTMFRRYPDRHQTLILLSNNYYTGFEALTQALETILLAAPL
ncbi:MAG: beta-lactamase family protein [Bacteroidetes bacterium]|nr:beta-lactamase family protein [Bacteroidota bacterium]